MKDSEKQEPIVVIMGPTASGKTELAIKLARRFNGEIICADSRTIYKHMNIGTMKPTNKERRLVPHWGLDLIEPNQHFSAADFKQYADEKIIEIRARGHVPFLVGGSGLYVDSVVFNYSFGPKRNIATMSELQHYNTEVLIKYCIDNNIKLPENTKNKRYLIRSIEVGDHAASKAPIPKRGAIIVGITTPKEELKNRIISRIDSMFDAGIIEETKILGERYSWDTESMKANIYPIVRDYTAGLISLEDAKTKAAREDWHLARKQMTWMRRNKFIHYFSLKEAQKYIEEQLAILE